jgi:hypothetical protein
MDDRFARTTVAPIATRTMDAKTTNEIRSVRNLDVYLRCKCINDSIFCELDETCEDIFAMLNVLEKKVDAFCK